MNVNLVVVGNGIDAIAFVVPNKIAGGGEHRKSMRFMGRRVYAGLVVVLITAIVVFS
jgi:hypothetical protein